VTLHPLVAARIDDLTEGLGKVRTRFVRDSIEGITNSRSLRLSRIGEALNEEIPLHATHKRLSRNLADEKVGQTLTDRILARVAATVTEDTRIVLDKSEIVKKFATKMQYLDEVKVDGEEHLGYRICEVLAGDFQSHNFTPMSFALWSSATPGYRSEQDEVNKLIQKIQAATDWRGTLVLNASLADNDEVLAPLVSEPRSRFIVRLYGSRELLHRRTLKSVSRLVDEHDLPYSASAFKYKDDRERQYCLQYGYFPVKLPSFPDRPLSLVVVRCDSYDEPDREPTFYYLLTSLPVRMNFKVLLKVVEAYTTRVQVVGTNRVIHDKIHLDDLRVLTYHRVRNLVALMMATMYSHAYNGVQTLEDGLTFRRKYPPPSIARTSQRAVVRKSSRQEVSFPNVGMSDQAPRSAYR
jgi:hypothetical protein